MPFCTFKLNNLTRIIVKYMIVVSTYTYIKGTKGHFFYQQVKVHKMRVIGWWEVRVLRGEEGGRAVHLLVGRRLRGEQGCRSRMRKRDSDRK